jgi:hypothetical protein
LLAGDRALAGGDVHAWRRVSAKLTLVSPDNVPSRMCTRLISRCPMPVRTNIFCKLKRQQRSAHGAGQQAAQEIPQIKTHLRIPSPR